jgi:hypothetical protein
VAPNRHPNLLLLRDDRKRYLVPGIRCAGGLVGVLVLQQAVSPLCVIVRLR